MAHAQETINYDGTAASAALLKDIDGYPNSLGPANLNNRTGNTITIDYDPATLGLAHISGRVVGAFDDAGNAMSGNRVTLKNGIVAKDIGGATGGENSTGTVSDNHVTVNDGTVSWGIYGGWSGSGIAKGNTATVSGGTVGDVYGGGSGRGTATGNTATVSGGMVDFLVFGG